MNILSEEAVHGMAVYSRREAQDLIGNRAHLNADIPLFHLLQDVWVPGQSESVSDTLRVEKEGIHQISIRILADVQRLSAMKQERDIHFLLLAVLPEF